MSQKKFENGYYYDFPIVKQYIWYRNCVRLRPTGHLVTGNRYHVDSGTDSTYGNSYRNRVPVSTPNLVTFFGDRFRDDLTKTIWENCKGRYHAIIDTNGLTQTVRKTKPADFIVQNWLVNSTVQSVIHWCLLFKCVLLYFSFAGHSCSVCCWEMNFDSIVCCCPNWPV